MIPQRRSLSRLDMIQNLMDRKDILHMKLYVGDRVVVNKGLAWQRRITIPSTKAYTGTPFLQLSKPDLLSPGKHKFKQ